MNEIEINDVRKITEFKGVTFSKYKKTHVKKELLNCLSNGNIESSCFWIAELVCSGNYSELWDIIITYISKHIHLGNPKIALYIDRRFQNFKEIVVNGYVDNELALRNNTKIRQLFAEIACVLCFSKRKPLFNSIKINKEEEFDVTKMTSKLKAPNIEYGQNILLSNDPKELFISINEFAFHISEKSKNIMSACYWVEWIIEFEAICKKRKEKCLCERRSFAPVESKFQTDIIWLIWDAIIYETQKRKNKDTLIKIINTLINIFSIRFSPGVKKRRKFILYYAIALLTESYNLDTPIINDQKSIQKIVDNINVIYKDVKKNEIPPETDYLFNGLKKSNLEKTIEKLEKFKNISTFVPRN